MAEVPEQFFVAKELNPMSQSKITGLQTVTEDQKEF